ncbi:hypothetical protein AMS68_004923 [Peltaster fructicola]|uniref:Cytochrome P450 n=1 Tax=Peltaster fructicola TaxID=286661 RepID=A0A6H0XXJ4_9PEZI|nr:hypothetical protein AMS68_004923 [Peltaster fructicola]
MALPIDGRMIMGILISLIYIFHRYLTYGMRVVPKGLPWCGMQADKWFALSRAHLNEWTRSRDFIKDGYKKHGKRGKAWLTPNCNWQPEVVLAPDQIKWLINLPESAVSIYKVLIEDVAFTYTSPRSWDFSRPFHVEALNKMDLALMTDEMVDEIDLCTKRQLGSSIGQSTTFELDTTMWNFMAHITNRVFAGKDIAHNEKYLACNKLFVYSLIPTAVIIKAFIPTVLQPVLGRLLALPCRYLDWRCSRYLKPELQRYMQAAVDARSVEDRNPNMLQLMARFAVRSNDPRDWNTHNLASRLLALNFVGIHTSSAAAINAWIDILTADPALLVDLRREIDSVHAESGGRWTKAAVARLVLLDSTLRESLRFSAFKARGVERQVVAPEGVYLPDGTHLPYGTKIGVPTVDIHRDNDFYDRADEFVPDRFVGKAEFGLVNTSDIFLAFGHGRHAWFFSAHELKLLFAHMLMHYDFEPLSTRPEHTWASDFYVPGRVEITCRRRL